MSSILGLTSTDFHDCFANDFAAAQVCFAGAVAAGTVTLCALKLINRDRASLTNIVTCSGIGTAAGFCASAYVANQSAPIVLDSDKALKFLAFTVATSALGSLPAKEGALIGLITFGGGIWPSLGRAPLYCAGLFASISGASYIIGHHSES